VPEVPVSPELALVDSELREQALDALATPEPFAFLDFAPDGDREVLGEPEPEPGLPLPLAAAAYALDAALHFLLVSVPVVAGLAALVALLASVK
jgi:hypothetical protein